MPKTPLSQHLDRPFEPVQDGGLSVRHQEKALELLQRRKALLEKSSPVSFVGADVEPRHPDGSAFHVLDQNLELLAPLLDAFDADSRPVRLAPGLLLRVDRKGELFPGFLHRAPQGHLVDRRPEGCHERLRHPIGRQGLQKPQLSADLRGDPLVGIQSRPDDSSGPQAGSDSRRVGPGPGVKRPGIRQPSSLSDLGRLRDEARGNANPSGDNRGLSNGILLYSTLVVWQGRGLAAPYADRP